MNDEGRKKKWNGIGMPREAHQVSVPRIRANPSAGSGRVHVARLEAVRVKAGCLIDRRLAISRTTLLPQLSCSSNARKPLILLSDFESGYLTSLACDSTVSSIHSVFLIPVILCPAQCAPLDFKPNGGPLPCQPRCRVIIVRYKEKNRDQSKDKSRQSV